jgi:hypothetical protein
MVYPFTQAAQPALAVGFIATNYDAAIAITTTYNMGKGLIALVPSVRYVGWHGARLAECMSTSFDPRSSFTWERHRILLGTASDGVCPCLPKWVRPKGGVN